MGEFFDRTEFFLTRRMRVEVFHAMKKTYTDKNADFFCAPSDCFRVISVNQEISEAWIYGDFSSSLKAISVVNGMRDSRETFSNDITDFIGCVEHESPDNHSTYYIFDENGNFLLKK